MFTLIIEDRSGNIADEVSFDSGSYTIGRVDGNDIILPSNAVSRTHARIFVSQGRVYIDDLGSANGVVVDGEQLTTRRELRNASQIRIGDYTLYLEQSNRNAQAQQDVLRTHIVADEASLFKLVRVGDMFAGEEFSLTEQVNTIGRTDDNFILLSDPSISRNHAQIVNEGMTFKVVDLGSSNGTRLNGKPLRGPEVIRPGDEVQFGNVRFIFAPTNQRVDPSMYAKPRKGGSSGLLIFVIVFLLLAIVGGGVVAVVMLTDDSDEKTESSEKDEEEKEEEPDPAAQNKERFNAAVSMANDQNWTEAQRLLTDITAADPDYPGARELQSQVMDELKNQSQLDQGDELLRAEQYDQAREAFELIPTSSVYYARAQKKLNTVRQRLGTDAFLEGRRACDEEPTVECVQKICESLEMNPEDVKPRDYLKELKESRELRKKKDVKKAIEDCL